jgi:hypothetical protein
MMIKNKPTGWKISGGFFVCFVVDGIFVVVDDVVGELLLLLDHDFG